ncbi:hypothetical protein LguiA_027001 [Lonicera macranthoides]
MVQEVQWKAAERALGLAGKDTFLGHPTPIPQLFCCGDSTFPGIGVPAVATSGAIVANSLVSVSQHSQLLDAVGSKTFANAPMDWVNVKDVANTYILAFKAPSASGRYCLVETVAHYSELVQLLQF